MVRGGGGGTHLLFSCQTATAAALRLNSHAHLRAFFFLPLFCPGYNRKKYVWKILYMYMLGYEIDFGHMEAVNLISSAKYSEKSVGYAWCALMLREGDELIRLIINSIRSDIISKQDNAICLALHSICNVGGKEFAEALAHDPFDGREYSLHLLLEKEQLHVPL